MQKLILERRSYGWAVWMYGIPNMPEDVELPLPFTTLAYLQTVAADMRKRFPGAYVFHRDKLGHVSHVAKI